MKAVLLATAVALCSTLAGAQTCNAPIQLSTATSILKVMQDLSNKLKALDGKQQVLTAAAKVSNTQVGQLAGNVGMLKSQFTADLQKSLCGNGRVEITEKCDDGNVINGDGCDSKCTVQTGWTCESTGGGAMSTCHTTSCAKLKCGKNAYCVSNEETQKYTCSCLGGYAGNAYNGCADVDECKNNPCKATSGQPGEVCVNQPGTYRCYHNFIGNPWMRPTSKKSSKTSSCTVKPCDNNHGLENQGGSYGKWKVVPKPSNVPEIPGNVRPKDGYMIEFDNTDGGYKEYEVHQASGTLWGMAHSGLTYTLCAWQYNMDSDPRNGIFHSRLWRDNGRVYGSTGLGPLPKSENRKWVYKCGATYRVNAGGFKMKQFSWYIGYPSAYKCLPGKRSCKVYVTGVQWLGPPQPKPIQYIENGWLKKQSRDKATDAFVRGSSGACTDPWPNPRRCDNEHGISKESGSYGRWRIEPFPSYITKSGLPANCDKDCQILKLYADGNYKEYEVHPRPGMQWADPANTNSFKDGVVYTVSAWVYNQGIKVTGNCGIQHIAMDQKGRRKASYGIGRLPASGTGWVKQEWQVTVGRHVRGGVDSFNWYIGWPFNGCRCLNGATCLSNADRSLDSCKCYAAVTGMSVEGPPRT